MRRRISITQRVLVALNTSNDIFWEYEVISAQLYARELLKFGKVQCWLGGKYFLYELNNGQLSYKVRENLNQNYSEIIGQIKINRLLKRFRITTILLLHKKLLESKHGL